MHIRVYTRRSTLEVAGCQLGGRICCVVGDVCIPRKRGGRHYIMPLHGDIQVRARKLGLDCLTPIIWHKIANGATEAEGNGAGFSLPGLARLSFERGTTFAVNLCASWLQCRG